MLDDQFQKVDFDAVVRLIFQPNPFRNQPEKTNWLSSYFDCRVFSSIELDQYLEKVGMSERIRKGESILVGLKLRQRGGIAVFGRWGQSTFYHAFPVSTIPLETILTSFSSSLVCSPLSIEALRQEPTFQRLVAEEVKKVLTERPRRVAVFIDGQNFLLAANKLGVSIPERVVALMRRILSFHEVRLARFYICWEADIGGFVIPPSLRSAIEQLDEIKIVDRQMKVIPNGGVFGDKKKIDIDAWLIPDLVATYSEQSGLEGIILVSGDSDYVPALRVWLREDKGGNKYVEVISSQGTLARELRELGGVRIRLLEEIIPGL